MSSWCSYRTRRVGLAPHIVKPTVDSRCDGRQIPLDWKSADARLGESTQRS